MPTVKIPVRGNSRAVGSYEPQLAVRQIVVPPGDEWSPRLQGWLVAHVSSGVGYWLHSRINCELQTGAVLLLSDQVQGCVRASQVGELRLHFFRLEPAKLTGLVTMADQRCLANAARDENLSFRVLAPNLQFSDNFRRLSSAETRNNLPARALMLQLFLEAFGGDFTLSQEDLASDRDASERLRKMLNHTPVSDLIEIRFSELVSKTGCSARHVSRLFTELVGTSFREKQSELRLARARELLATTNSKVLEVALESGYQSPSLFNKVFKRRFQVSPAKWREQARRTRPAGRAASLAPAAPSECGIKADSE